MRSLDRATGPNDIPVRDQQPWERDMDCKLLGASGLSVSAFSLGTMTFGRKDQFAAIGEVGQEDARAFVDCAIANGINLFDTADIYADGRSEEILGQALGPRRKDVLVATKVYQRMGSGPNDLGLSRRHIVAACEESLRRLGTDYIDLYQSHGQDMMTPVEETLRAYDDLIRAGKVRYIGCSNHAAWHLMKTLATADRLGTPRYISQQVDYSLLDRDIEWELIPAGLDQGVGVMAYSPLASGLLSGKYRAGAPTPDGARAAVLPVPQARDRGQLDRIVALLADIAGQRDVPLAQVALNWVRQRPAVDTVILGARTIAQLEANLGAARWRLTDEECRRLDSASRTAPAYPYWHLVHRTGERNPYYAARAHDAEDRP
jgi:aryl-alcohol dehydrogenase-like predicted oxidoreductase